MPNLHHQERDVVVVDILEVVLLTVPEDKVFETLVKSGPFVGALGSRMVQVAVEVEGKASNIEEVRNISPSNFIPVANLKFCHPVVKGMFPIEPQHHIRPVGKVQHFLPNWEVLTQDPQVLEVVRVSGFSSWRSRYNG